MNARDLSTIAVKLFGLWLVIDYGTKLLAYFPVLFRHEINSGWYEISIVLFSRGILPIGVGAVLFLFGGLVSEKFFPYGNIDAQWEAFEGRLVGALGIILFVVSFSDVLALAVYFYKYHELASPGRSGVPVDPKKLSEMANAVVRTCFGAWLALGNEGIIRIVEKLRGRQGA